VRHILEKLEAANRAEAVHKALQIGLLNQDQSI
jgi:DNA-binding CsgD family transcriptional regulator